MVIKNLDDAEIMVNNHPNLSWDGWTIIHKIQDDSAEYDIRGSYDKKAGKWFRRIPYQYVDDMGWVVPNSLSKG